MPPADDPATIYETELVPAMFRPWAEVLVDFARPRPGERVLDAACGTGVVARRVVPLVGRAGRTVGLDFDPAMIAMAARLAPEIEWRQGDLQSLPFADGEFDLVLCQQGLQFLRDRDAGLKQMLRVLRPGGRVALAVWTDLAKSPGQAALFGAMGELLGEAMGRPAAWSLSDGAQLEKLVAAAGFVDIETKIASLPSRYASARRFVEILLDGSSKVTREALAQLPTERKAAFIDDVVRRLRDYETSAGLEFPMESRLLLARKR